MTPQIAEIFYNPKVKTRFNHPKFNNCQVKLLNYKSACSNCGMIGHNDHQCCEGLKQFVSEHGPNLRSKFTHVGSGYSKDYDINSTKLIKNTFLIRNTTNDGTADFRWKCINEKAAKVEFSQIEGKDFDSKILKKHSKKLESTANLDVSNHVFYFCKTIKDLNITQMGSQNWKNLYNKHHSEFINSSSNLIEYQTVEKLEIFRVIGRSLTKSKSVKIDEDSLKWITLIFISTHISLWRKHYSEIQKKFEVQRQEMINKISLNNEKETFSFINSINRTCIGVLRLILGSKNLGILKQNDKPSNEENK